MINLLLLIARLFVRRFKLFKQGFSSELSTGVRDDTIFETIKLTNLDQLNEVINFHSLVQIQIFLFCACFLLYLLIQKYESFSFI